jgi:hypothetical protein
MQPMVLGTLGLGVAGALALVYTQLNKGALGGIVSSGGKKKIIILQTRDKRAYELPIKRERELTLEAKKDGKERRYYKAGPGFTLPNGTTIFFGLEGSAYTAIVKDDKSQSMGLPAAMRSLWGDQAYDKMPQALKEPLEKHRFGVTIYPEKIANEDKMVELTAESVDDENDKKALDHLGNALKNNKKMDWMTFLQGAAIGLAVCYILANMHVLPVVVK